MFKPLKERLIVKPIPLSDRSPSGKIIVTNDAGLRPDTGYVQEVGEGIKDVKKGDKVLFGKYTGSELKFEDEVYLIMKEEEIFAILP